ncbi:MAG: ArgE/DapE family deacylase [Chitinivibrionales bacterium]|nr:ArgE/DapE family deacylase [Chitinivibrionales bacterium]
MNSAGKENLSRELDTQVDRSSDEIREFLTKFIGIRSYSEKEYEAQEFLNEWLQSAGFKSHLISTVDKHYRRKTFHFQSNGTSPAPNLACPLSSPGKGRSLLINSHSDVVPVHHEELFTPKVDGDKVFGRGAVDAKGQIATWILAFLALKRADVSLRGECIGSSVIEEETGGNGSQSWIRDQKNRDLVIVMEPADLIVHPAARGGLWFRITTTGVPIHLGRWWEGESAFENLEIILKRIREWEQKIVEESKGIDLFPDNPSPVRVNVGVVRAGDWAASVPADAKAEGGVTFLPNKNTSQIHDEMRSIVKAVARERGFEADIEFQELQNESYFMDINHPGVKLLDKARKEVLGTSAISGYLASCDAQLFYHKAEMPALVFGPGDLREAHSDHEFITMQSIRDGAKILSRFIVDWCGVE